LLVAACREVDILVNNNAGPPPGSIADWSHEAWLGALEANLLAAAMLIREVLPGMRQRKFGRIVNPASFRCAERPGRIIEQRVN
jgi:3-oxoacyl-[acyl-carrier protein] reductase